MAIGDKFDARSLTAYDWEMMAIECGLNTRLVGRELKQMADKVLKIWPELKQNLIAIVADDLTLKAIEAVLNQQ